MRRRPAVSDQELDYYRAHIREALREDGVVCLECGGVYRALESHLRHRHRLAADHYREKWGYNRRAALMVPGLREQRRQHAIAMNLRGLVPPDPLRAGREALPRALPPRRLQARLNMSKAQLDRLTARGIKKVPDETLRAFVGEGLTATEIAGRTGMSASAVRTRLWALRRLGFAVPPLPGPRRRLSDEELLAFLRDGLRVREIAARAGVARASVYQRLRALRRRGLLPPAPGALPPGGCPRRPEP